MDYTGAVIVNYPVPRALTYRFNPIQIPSIARFKLQSIYYCVSF